jgi:hypothetical protein
MGEAGTSPEDDAVALHHVAHLKERRAHADAYGLRLVRARDDAPVVVREHDDGPAKELRVEYALAGDVEVVAVHERERAHGL